MKNSKIYQIAILISTLIIGSAAWGVPPAGSPYYTDPQNEYVQDATSDAIGSVNMVLCIMDAMNVGGSGMLNVGPYVALIDINKCQSHGSTGSSTGGASGATVAANYMTAVVDATRASTSDPMVAKIWMSLTEDNSTKDIFVKVTATQSPTDVPPYGVFRLDYVGKIAGGGAMQFNGYIDSAAGTLKFLETGPNSSNVALSMTAGTTTSGTGTMTVGAGATTYNFNYTPSYFRRSESGGVNDQCFDRARANADRSVWRYGTYKVSDGTRVDQANPSFQITATYGGSSYYGSAGYYGINFQGLDLNGIPDASPIAGLTVSDQRPGNTTTYTLSKVGGKLTKWSSVSATLAAMDGIPFTFSADLTGKTTGGSPAVTGWGNWQMQWNDTAANFTVTGTQVCGMSGCTISTLTTPATVNAGAFNGMPIAGWSDSFGGNINIPASAVDHVSGDPINYFVQSIVIPGSGTAPANLYCLSNCLDASTVGAANAYANGSVPSPFGGTTATQWFSAPGSGNTVSYTFDANGLKNAGTAMIVNNAAYFAASPMYQFGVMSGRLFDTALTSGNCPAGVPGGTVCEPSAPAVYYTWSTGLGQWNQTMWLKNGSTVVAFDPPQNVSYTVPPGAAYGTWAGKTIQLQFNGFGNLYGIPGYCVNPVDNSPADCSGGNVRYVPMFSIPDTATMTLNGTPIIVKALDAEVRLKDLGAAAAACSGMSLAGQTPPVGGTHDMSSSSDAYYIGVKPTVTTSPKVIDGIVQY